MNRPIMYHVVAGYPDPEACLRLMLAMQASGAAALEVQVPFSDPIADGEAIMQANDAALAAGMTTAGSFELVAKAREQGLETDLYFMSYLQKVRHFGLAEFCEQAAKCQAKGLIIPDLPYDSPEFPDLRALAGKHGLALVPVLSPGMVESRLRDLLALDPPVLYVTSQQGITGNEYTPAVQLKQVVADIKKSSRAKIMIGFGISTPDDVYNALEIGDVAVVGSAVIKKIAASGIEAAAGYIASLVKGAYL
jgi:tryptophan synthase alpha chain